MYSSLPKVLHTIAGKAMLAHVLDSAQQLNPESIFIVYGHGGQAVPDFFANRTYPIHHKNNQPVFVQQTEQLGTGHAVLQVEPLLADSGLTLVLYGDVPLIQASTLQHLVHSAQQSQALSILTACLDQPEGYGRITRNSLGAVTGIVEHKDATQEQLTIREVNTGIMVMPSAYLKKWVRKLSNQNAQAEYYLTDIVKFALADKLLVQTVFTSHEWEVIGVNTRVQQAQLERTYQKIQAHKLLEQGVTIIDPERIDIRGELLCSTDVHIDVGCVFEGRVTLGSQVQIGAHCVLRNCSLADGVIIHPFTHIDGADIGSKTQIGPYARLRPGTELGAQVRIGNFVEIKNAQFDKAAKANHLAYIGDASVGAEVNIGAGVITCNYDGANKHHTTIGAQAFIGSNSALVAPLTVGAGATIGAGTILTKDAPEQQLTLARIKPISIQRWQRPRKV